MKIAVGMSGGVDSTVAAMLLKKDGHDVLGVTMSLDRADEARNVAAAEAAAAKAGVPLKVFDFSAQWREEVLGYAKATYLAGRTPNPCVRCNETVKFGLLPRAAFALGCELFATGHYARTENRGGTARLLRGADRTKDQSYFLYRVPGEILARTVFPLGGLTKREVRELARAAGAEFPRGGESRDFCGGDPAAGVGAARREGDIVTLDGRVIGRHGGFWRYTVGMRRGLGVGGGTPYYVVRLDAARNEVVVGFKADAVWYDLELVDTVGTVDRTLPVKVRSAGEPRLLSDGVAGAAPGQSAVFYRGDEVAGGGVIAESPAGRRSTPGSPTGLRRAP
ncbi:MAG: 7-cyano-7-deazaguanine synthase [Kiritimatiellae bacterium]|nr:7-cyano-7-deazaguanine synthase [Kiritimatiellia bacterium]